jgi:TM2 domain-containing membrane protein YozV
MTSTQDTSPKSGLTTFVLCFFFGSFGIHRFYVGKIGTGILMLLTGGGLWFWTLYDIFSIVCKNFTDSQGRTVDVTHNPTAPRNVVITVFCLVIVFFGLVFSIAGMSVRALASVGKDELAALRNGNIDQAYSYTSSEFHKGVSVDTFKKFVDSYPQLRNNVDSTFTDMEYKNNNGLITGTLTMKDGSTTPVEIELLKENDQWKINGINVKANGAQETNPAPAKDTSAAQPANPEPAKDAAPASTQQPDQGSDNTDDSSN